MQIAIIMYRTLMGHPKNVCYFVVVVVCNFLKILMVSDKTIIIIIMYDSYIAHITSIYTLVSMRCFFKFFLITTKKICF